jgi:hypothetical protein
LLAFLATDSTDYPNSGKISRLMLDLSQIRIQASQASAWDVIDFLSGTAIAFFDSKSLSIGIMIPARRKQT